MDRDDVKESLNSPAESTLALGGLSFLGAIPLWLLIPLLLIFLGLGVWFTIMLLPFLVSAIFMFITFYIFRHYDVSEPWLYIGPMIFGTIALLPVFVPGIHTAIVNSLSGQVAGAQAVQAQGFLNGILDIVVKGPLFIAAVIILVFLAIGLASIVRLGSPGAFIAGFLGLGFALALTFNVAGLSLGTGVAAGGAESNADLNYSSFSHGQVKQNGKLWKAYGGQTWNWTHWKWTARMSSPVKLNDWLYDEVSVGDDKVKQTWRWKSKSTISAKYTGQWASRKNWNESATIAITPPTHQYRTESGDALSQSDFEPVKVQATAKGDVDVTPKQQGVTGSEFAISCQATREAQGTVVLKVIFEKTVTKKEDQDVHNPTTGRNEMPKILGMSVLVWIVLAAVIPSGSFWLYDEYMESKGKKGLF